MKKKISIVVPAYNESECLIQLVKKTDEVLSSLPYEYELIIVDDGSQDNSFSVIRELSQKYPFVKGIRLSRNMGHQSALDCGLKHASGDAVICMDADLQHPPSLIPKMITLWEEGYDVVTTQKIETQDYSLSYKIFAKTFYKIFNKYSHIKIVPNASDFRLMSRKSLNAVLAMPEYHRFYRGLVPYVGFKTTNLTFVVDKRFAGKRKYTFKKSLALASNGLFSFSDFALKVPFIIGLISLTIIVAYLLVILGGYLCGYEHFVRGWTSIIVILVLSISLQLIFMGIMGIYIGKIFLEVKHRPIYFIDEIAGDIQSPENYSK
ncbi:MAG TPA: glycosyltransferase family 2 protein [Bacteroidales bacterium]|nr:glycosyltransferase family 2 protein [Bacteroidales bacterium]